jgi:hypothetical protein
MSVPHNDIVQFAEDVIASIAGMRASAFTDEPPHHREEYLSGGVRISGAWSGLVLVHCTPALARRVAAVYFDVAPDSATQDDIRDVLGELANILAGNVKPLLPGPSRLSLPFTDVTARAVELHAGEEAWLECSGEPFVVKVLSEVETAIHADGRVSSDNVYSDS